MLERNSKLMTKKMFQYLIPSILMIFAMQFGSLLDGILVGNLIQHLIFVTNNKLFRQVSRNS